MSGLLSRVHSMLTATAGALEAPAAFVKDTVTALPELGTLNFSDFSHDMYKAFTTEGANELQNTIGPQGIGGQAIGALPAGIRQQAGSQLNAGNDAMNTAYSALISKPLSTALTAATIGTQHSLGDLGTPDTWAESWNIAQHRSPGQSLALAFMTNDVLDPNQVKKAQGTDWYNAVSGVTDAATRTILDPTALALGGGSEFMDGLRSVDGAQSIDRLTQSGAISKLADSISSVAEQHGAAGAPAAIRTVYPSLDSPTAYALAQAHFNPGYADVLPGMESAISGQAAVERTLRAVIGGAPEIDSLRTLRADVAGMLQRQAAPESALSALGINGTALVNDPVYSAGLDPELQATYDQRAYLDRVDQATKLQETSSGLQGAGNIAQLPRPGGVQALRGQAQLSDWYQNGPFSRLLHVATILPDHFLQLDDPNSDLPLFRMLQRSDLSTDDQLALRSNYMKATNPADRAAAATDAENAAVASIGQKAGIAPDDLNDILTQAKDWRGQTIKSLQSMSYGSDGRGEVSYIDEQGIAHKMSVPLFGTQLPNLHPLVNMDDVRDAISPIKTFLARQPAYTVPKDLADKVISAWKPGVLMNPAFGARFVGGEGLLSAAKIGSLAALRNMGGGLRDAAAGALSKVGIDLSNDDLGPALGGHQFEGPFGPPGDGANTYHALISARHSWGSLVTQDEGKQLDDLIASGDWRTVDPANARDAKAYPAAWEHAVNKQIGQDPLGSKLLEEMQPETKTHLAEGAVSPTRDDVVNKVTSWLQNDPEGQRAAAKMPAWNRTHLQDWVNWSHDEIDHLLPTPELKAAAWNGSATHDMLAAEFPNAADRPIVHGGVVQESLGGPTAQFVRKSTDTVLKGLVSKPTDYLVRNGLFDNRYNAEISRQASMLAGADLQPSLPARLGQFLTGGTSAANLDNVSPDDLAKIEYAARRYALGQVRSTFHDFGTRYQFSDMLGNLAPFANAWGQIASRWAHVAVDNPAFLRRLQIIWRSPERAGLVTDGAGNVLNEDDRIASPVPGNPAYKVGAPAADSTRNVTLSLPSWVHDIPGLGALAGQDKIRFNKSALNFALHGLPNVGPFVQIPVNEIAKSRPALESSLKFVLPYGTSQNSMDILKPSLLRNVQAQSEGDQNRSFAYLALSIYSSDMADYRRGVRQTAPTWTEVDNKAQALWHLKTVSRFLLPGSPQFVSPYQPQLDMYKARQAFDDQLTPAQKALPTYETPDEWFLNRLGPEYFPLTAAMSKSMDAIPPTLQGQQAHQQYGPFLAQYPQLGGLLTGEIGAGAFSNAVYQAQFAQRIGPGATEAERSVTPHDVFQNEASVNLGWITYTKIADALDAILKQRGLANYSVKGASDLKAVKTAVITMLANDPRYQGWYQDYGDQSSTKWDQRIAGLTALTKLPGQTDRPEIAGLKNYLQAREAIVGALTANTAHPYLDASSNQQLSMAWESYISGLVDSNPAFGALYNRWLANDPVPVTPLTPQAEAGTLAPVAPLVQG